MALFNGINVVSIAVPDLAAAREFYANVLRLGEPEYDLPEAGWIEFAAGGPGGNVAVTTAEPGWEPATGTTIVFNTGDCHAACAELRARGVRCDDPSGRLSRLRDVLQLLRPVRQPPADVQPGAGGVTPREAPIER